MDILKGVKLLTFFNPIYPVGPYGKDCPGTENWTGPEARAFGTFIII